MPSYLNNSDKTYSVDGKNYPPGATIQTLQALDYLEGLVRISDEPVYRPASFREIVFEGAGSQTITLTQEEILNYDEAEIIADGDDYSLEIRLDSAEADVIAKLSTELGVIGAKIPLDGAVWKIVLTADAAVQVHVYLRKVES